ncbi:MAG: ABC-F family ATP-binding cassette domain-containing protein [Fimbriimonas sp.]|nr:ABC-F family ATP-binding cassette domain-containing protein [Fimbriimonas sp.]
MLQAFGLSFCPDPRAGSLFENVDISVGDGEKVALVGRNGAGKSLLLRILAERLKPSTGKVVYASNCRAAYLAQDFDLAFDGSLSELFERDAPELPVYAIARAMNRLGLDPDRLHQPFQTLSLGERMRGTLAMLLATEPDILLLDEPTNHLDVEAKEWLERFLCQCPEGVLFACHDRSVINSVATRLLELERGGIASFTGDYDDMVRYKAQRDARQRIEWQAYQQEDRRLRITAEESLQRAGRVSRKPTKGTYDPFHKPFYAAKQARMDRKAKAILMRVEKAREDAPDKPFEEMEPELVFPMSPLRSHQVMTARKLRKSYGSKLLFEGLHITLDRGSKIALVGANGSGKTTLFRLLLGDEAADAGEILWSPDARIATLSQARDRLSPGHSAIQALGPADAGAEKFARTALARLGLRGDTADRPIGVLSVGERTKVEIVAMVLSGANVLVLDEPTNHLDLAAVVALERALTSFPGAILFTSHDREFVQRLATEVIRLG